MIVCVYINITNGAIRIVEAAGVVSVIVLLTLILVICYNNNKINLTMSLDKHHLYNLIIIVHLNNKQIMIVCVHKHIYTLAGICVDEIE
jgi:hypothetical protein